MIGVSDRYRECFLYVDAEDRTAVLDALARRFAVESDRRTLTLPGVELDVVGNDARTLSWSGAPTSRCMRRRHPMPRWCGSSPT
jgi:hypothetical protein